MGKLVSRHKNRRLSEISPSHQVSASELLAIKDHPDRIRKRSSVAPLQPAIKEEKLLEELCVLSDIEPDKPVDDLEKKAVKKLTRKLSKSEKISAKEEDKNPIPINSCSLVSKTRESCSK